MHLILELEVLVLALVAIPVLLNETFDHFAHVGSLDSVACLRLRIKVHLFFELVIGIVFFCPVALIVCQIIVFWQHVRELCRIILKSKSL